VKRTISAKGKCDGCGGRVHDGANGRSSGNQLVVIDGWVDLGMDARRIGNNGVKYNGVKYNGVAHWRSASRSTYYKQAVAMPNHVMAGSRNPAFLIQ
jgi:hypothetical protein